MITQAKATPDVTHNDVYSVNRNRFIAIYLRSHLGHRICVGSSNRIEKMSSQPQPIHIITVDSTPAKAWEILAGLIKVAAPRLRTLTQVTNFRKAVEKDYNLVHVANCEGKPRYPTFSSSSPQANTCLIAIRDVKPVLSSLVVAPKVLVSATPDLQ